MIDPDDITKFNRTDAELEEFWLFSCVVAGKTAVTQARFLDEFLISIIQPGETPFQAINAITRRDSDRSFLNPMSVELRYMNGSPTNRLDYHLQKSRLGQYNRLSRCFRESLSLDLRNDPVERFEEIFGVGPKTSRLFVMHSRPNQRLAAIDTHILKFLGAEGFNVPKVTPSSPKKYRELENIFLSLADEAGESPADFDLRIWRSYSRKAI